MSILGMWLAATGDVGDVLSLDPPTSLAVYFYSGGERYGVQWVNGEPAADTELYEDDVLIWTMGPGITSKDLGTLASHTYKVRHRSGANVSAYSNEVES